jgi:hypothetical protein
MEPWTPPWAPGAATGVGPMPGTDPHEATRVVVGEVPVPYLPELPGRGPGADPVGRTAALLVDLHADIQAGRWRLVPRPSADERRARELLERDLDALEEVAGSHAGPVKVQAMGPWSLAASLELARGEKVLADHGATRELAVSLSEGLRLHVAAVRSRLSRVTRVMVQVDESLLPSVLAGTVPTASGWARLPRPEPAPAEQTLTDTLAAVDGDAGLRCDWPGAPLSLFARTGARFVSLDARDLDTIPEEDLGQAIEDGIGFLLGLVPRPGRIPHHDDPADVAVALAAPARRVWNRLGLADGYWDRVVVTPADDLSDLDLDQAATVLGWCTATARSLQTPEGDTHAEELGP